MDMAQFQQIVSSLSAADFAKLTAMLPTAKETQIGSGADVRNSDVQTVPQDTIKFGERVEMEPEKVKSVDDPRNLTYAGEAKEFTSKRGFINA